MSEKKSNGRPVGSLNKLSRNAIEQARSTGLLPHEILLDIARGNPQPMLKWDEDKQTVIRTGYEMPTLEDRKDAAGKAAPYYAPKISTVEVVGNMSDAELDRIITSLAAEAGIAVGTSGEGQTGEEEEGEDQTSRVVRKRIRPSFNP